jgi:hypothetical protein
VLTAIMTMASRIARKTFSVGEVAGDYCRRWILALDAAGIVRLIGCLLSNADERGFARMFADRAFFLNRNRDCAGSFALSAAFRDHPRSSAFKKRRRPT